MGLYPQLNNIPKTLQMTSAFGGYFHAPRIKDGEFFDMKNMTGEFLPVVASRRKRGTMHYFDDLQGIACKEALAWINGGELWWNGLPVQGITLSTAPEMLPKQMVSMGAYLCVFPDKVYINTIDLADKGRMDATYTTPGGVTASIKLSNLDGTLLQDGAILTSPTAPASPTNGMYWIDTSEKLHILKRYNASTSEWVQIPTTYLRIEATGIGQAFKAYDGVKLSGLAATAGVTPSVTEQVSKLNGDVILYAQRDNYVVIAGLVDQAVQLDGAITVTREVPDMDYVTEGENRLWGCKYGMSGGKVVNEIYACKLGDFKNWRCYMGLSTDSYAVSVGSDGKFTGAGTLSGNPIFFKEDCMHRVMGNMPSQYHATVTMCRGIEDGSWRSLAVVNESMIYKAREGYVRYDGSLPIGINEALGKEIYHDASAGVIGDMYYTSARKQDGSWVLLVYNSKTGQWYKEDNTHALCFAGDGKDLYYLDAPPVVGASGKSIRSVRGKGTAEVDVVWSVTSGIQGFASPNQKYLSRFNIRMSLEQLHTAQLEIQYDSDGVWHQSGTIQGQGLNTVLLPVRPRRCDHLQWRLSGTGEVKLFSVARYDEDGSDD